MTDLHKTREESHTWVATATLTTYHHHGPSPITTPTTPIGPKLEHGRHPPWHTHGCSQESRIGAAHAACTSEQSRRQRSARKNTNGKNVICSGR